MHPARRRSSPMLRLPRITFTTSHPVQNVCSLRRGATRSIFRHPSLHSLMDEQDKIVKLAVRYELFSCLKFDHTSPCFNSLQRIGLARREERLACALKVEVPPRR